MAFWLFIVVLGHTLGVQVVRDILLDLGVASVLRNGLATADFAKLHGCMTWMLGFTTPGNWCKLGLQHQHNLCDLRQKQVHSPTAGTTS